MCAVISFRSCSGRAAQDHIPGTDLLSLSLCCYPCFIIFIFLADLILCWLLSFRLSFGWFLFPRPLFARILPDFGGAELTRFSFFYFLGVEVYFL
jgi:hypothetical protein